MSHLLTPNIVKTFNKNVQKICKLLEITMENIKNNISPEEINAIVEGFKSVEQANARVQQVEQEKKKVEQENIELKKKIELLEKQLADREATNSQS